MRAIQLTHTYKKQYKKLKRSGADMRLLDHTIKVLMTENASELERLWDHQLKGKLAAYREIHVGQSSSNWVVQYQVMADGTLLILLQTGSHNTVLRL